MKAGFSTSRVTHLPPPPQVRAGEKFPIDGVVVDGTCPVDEAMITGESMLISKQKDSLVIGGTILQSGMAHVRATHVGKDASLARIVQLMEQAQMSKAPVQRIAGGCGGQESASNCRAH